MSYRIHINILKRKDYENYLKEYEENRDEDKYFNFDSCIRSEISDGLALDHFSKVPIKEEEYPPYILTKEDFRIILVFYQKEQLNIAKKRLKIYEEIKKSYNKENKFLDDSQVFDFMWQSVNQNHHTQWYFERCQKNNIFIPDSDYFQYQYFYLVKLYESFDDKKDVLVITHG